MSRVTMNPGESDSKLTEDEIALYDRQIRLWGMAAQARMRSARVLLINLSSIGTEICKNIVLSGLGSLTILDHHLVTQSDLGSQFYVNIDDVGSRKVDAAKERILDLNPRVKINFDADRMLSKPSHFFNAFDLVIGTQLTTKEMLWLNGVTRQFNLPLYLTGSNGLFGYIFVDLIEFQAEDEKIKSAKATSLGKVSENIEVVEVRIAEAADDKKKLYETVVTNHKYKSFGQMLDTATLENKLNRRQLKRLSSAVPLTLALFALDDGNDALTPQILLEKATIVCKKLGLSTYSLSQDYVEQFVRQRNAEFSPVSAILGGAVAQDVINIMGKRQSPLNNTVILDGITLDMPMFEL